MISISQRNESIEMLINFLVVTQPGFGMYTPGLLLFLLHGTPFPSFLNIQTLLVYKAREVSSH